MAEKATVVNLPPSDASAAADAAAFELAAILKESKKREAALSAALNARDAAVAARDEASRLREETALERNALVEARVVADAKLGTAAREAADTEAGLLAARERVAELSAAVSEMHLAAEAARAKAQSLALAAEVVSPIGLHYLRVADVTLGCLRKDNPVRRVALMFTRSVYFDWFILANIAVNFIVLAAADPLGPSQAGHVEVLLEPYFQALFAAEALLKIIAIGAAAYFSDGWCITDFVVVVMTFLVYIPGTGNASALRALRALRPLRTFGLIPSLRRNFNGIIAVGAHILRVDLLEWFLMFASALVAVQLWAGTMSGGCFYPDPNAPYTNTTPPWLSLASSVTSNTAGIVPSTKFTVMPGFVRNRMNNNFLSNAVDARGFCAVPPATYSQAGLEISYAATAPPASTCPPVYYTLPGATTSTLATNQACMAYANPLSYGAPQRGFSFDDVGIGFLTTYVIETEEGWATAFYPMWHSWGAPWLVAIWFLYVIMFIDEYVGVMLDASNWIVYLDSSAREIKKAEYEGSAKAISEIVSLERVALKEMYGSWAPRNAHEKAAQTRKARAKMWSQFVSSVAHVYTNYVPGVPAQLAKAARSIESTKWFNNLSMLIVFANIISLACDHSTSSDAYDYNLKVANWAFVAFFVIELVLRLLSNGARLYLSEVSNVFDFVIVIVSVVDVATTELFASGGSGLSALRVLRVFRVFRSFKLARNWRKLNSLLTTMGRAVVPALNFLGITGVFVVVFAVIGMQIFGGRYTDAIAAGRLDEYPRTNFDNFGWALVTVFNVVDDENWFIGPVAALFFIALQIIGGVVFALMLSTFMSTIDDEEEEEEREALRELLLEAEKKEAADLDAASPAATPASSPTEITRRPSAAGESRDSKPRARRTSLSEMEAQRWSRMLPPLSPRTPAAMLGADAAVRAEAPTHPLIVMNYAKDSSRLSAIHIELPPRSKEPPRSLIDAGALQIPGRSTTLRIDVTSRGATVVGVDSQTGRIIDARRLMNPAASFDGQELEGEEGYFVPLRRTVSKYVYSDAFDWLSLAVTLWSCLNLALDEPWLQLCGTAFASSACATSGDNLIAYLMVSDAIVTAFFATEIAVKCFAQGLWLDPHSYLRSGWNIVDVIMTISSIISLILGQQRWVSGVALRAIRSIRAMRVLRGLRFFRNVHLAYVMDTIYVMIPAVLNAASLVALFIYIFAVIGLQTFMGTANICNDFTVTYASECIGNMTVSGSNCAYLPTPALEAACRAMGDFSNFTVPRLFEAQLPNWDDFGNALLQTYMLSDGENWPNLMYNAVDSGHKVGDPMVRDTDQTRAAFFVILILVMDSVVLDLLVGVVRSSYRALRNSADGRAFLSHGERKLLQNTILVVESYPLVRHLRPPSPELLGGLPAMLHRYVHTEAFEALTLLAVFACTVALSIHSSTMNPGLAAQLRAIYYLFTFAFAAEVGARVMSDGLDPFFRHGWNLFDAATVLTAVIGAGLSIAFHSGVPGAPNDFGAMRVALAFRSFRLVSAIHFLQIPLPFLRPLLPVMRALRRAFPRFLQLILFFAVFIYIYAIVGMAAFGNVRHGYAGDDTGGNPARSTGNINPDTNFETFPVAWLTMFRSYTGENWNFFMTDLMVQAPYCVDSSGPENTCGSPVFSAIFFISYMFFVTFVFDALMGATILEAYWLDVDATTSHVGWDDPIGRRLYNFTHGAAVAFQEAWAYFDPHGDVKGITLEQLEAVVAMVDTPLGARLPPSEVAAAATVAEGKVRAAELVRSLDLGGETACISYHAALYALVARASTGYGHAMGTFATGTHKAGLIKRRRSIGGRGASRRSLLSSTRRDSATVVPGAEAPPAVAVRVSVSGPPIVAEPLSSETATRTGRGSSRSGAQSSAEQQHQHRDDAVAGGAAAAAGDADHVRPSAAAFSAPPPSESAPLLTERATTRVTELFDPRSSHHALREQHPSASASGGVPARLPPLVSPPSTKAGLGEALPTESLSPTPDGGSSRPQELHPQQAHGSAPAAAPVVPPIAQRTPARLRLSRAPPEPAEEAAAPAPLAAAESALVGLGVPDEGAAGGDDDAGGTGAAPLLATHHA